MRHHLLASRIRSFAFGFLMLMQLAFWPQTSLLAQTEHSGVARPAFFMEATAPSTPPPVSSLQQTGNNPFQEQNGQVVMEAEHYDGIVSRSAHDWTFHTDIAGYVGDGFMRAEPDTGGLINSGYATTSPELQFRAQFTTTGTYYVWARVYSIDNASDSLHAGLDNQAITTADRISV
jgi:hypothetical protein